MILDFIIVSLGLLLVFKGYNKGLITFLLSLLNLVLAIFFAKLITEKCLFIKVGYFSFVLQFLILASISLFLGKYIINYFRFENIVLLGTISRILGGIFYLGIFLLVLLILVKLISYFCMYIDISFLNNSYVFKFLKDFISRNNL